MPSINMLESKIKRLQRDISQLETNRANAAKDEGDALKKINRVNSTLARTKNLSTIKNKEREIQRENDKVQRAKGKQADLLMKISRKNTDLNKAQRELSKENKREQEKIHKEQERKIKNFKINQSKVADEILQQPSQINNGIVKEFDVFISHSSDDKDSFVNDLATSLKKSNISIWYDTDSIGWGQSIRQEIDKGLAHSKYGIVVISPSFIEKYWTSYELDGILQKEGSTGRQMILPIWHNVTADQVQKYSYSISLRNALNTGINTMEDIVENLKKLLHS